MQSSLKNITVILIISTLAFAGYYLFIKKDEGELDLTMGSTTEALFVDVQKYIERRQLLDQIDFDIALFNEQRFRSLIRFSASEEEQPIGRPNPFDTVNELPS